jgi:hypothetical protein
LHNEELRDFFSSLNIIGVIKYEEDDTGGECGTYRGQEKCHRVLVGKYEGTGRIILNGS